VTRFSIVVAAVIVASASPAVAGSKLKLYTLSSTGLPRALREAPTELTRVIGKSLDATAQMTSIDDVATVLNCAAPEDRCLELVAQQAQTRRLVFGHIEPDPETRGVIVKVKTYTVGKSTVVKRYLLEGSTVEELAADLAKQLEPAKAAKPVEPTPDPDPPVKRVPTEPTPQGPTDGVKGPLSRTTLVLLIGGGVVAAGGGGLLLAANALRDDIARAPTDTREQIEQLLALENAAKLRSRAGVGLVAVGGVALAIGIYRAVKERRSGTTNAAPNPTDPVIDIVPEAGGATMWFRMGWK
jgi:hypothetical protein